MIIGTLAVLNGSEITGKLTFQKEARSMGDNCGNILQSVTVDGRKEDMVMQIHLTKKMLSELVEWRGLKLWLQIESEEVIVGSRLKLTFTEVVSKGSGSVSVALSGRSEEVESEIGAEFSGMLTELIDLFACPILHKEWGRWGAVCPQSLQR